MTKLKAKQRYILNYKFVRILKIQNVHRKGLELSNCDISGGKTYIRNIKILPPKIFNAWLLN